VLTVDFGRGSGASTVASRASGSTGIALEALVMSVLELQGRQERRIPLEKVYQLSIV
jgi:hypothetical protein